jgi:hypothetical protein
VWLENRPLLSVMPFGFRAGAEAALWEPRRRYRATLRPKGGPVVRRPRFAPDDAAAFELTQGSWSVDGGVLSAEGSACVAWFGEPAWDLLHAVVTGEVAAGAELGLAVLADPSTPSAGLWVRLRRMATGASLHVTEGTDGAPPAEHAVAVGEGPLSLSIDVFADVIRVAAGDRRLDLPRGGRGPGRCALLGSSARFFSLHVRGLAMYGFDFETSRYRSFGEHVRSIRGVESMDLDAVLDTPQAAWSRFAGEVADAMRPPASDAQREFVFSELASHLGLLLRETVDRVHLTTLRHTSALMWLLESPEPMDFVEEIRLRLEREVPVTRASRSAIEDLLDRARRAVPFPLDPLNPAPTPAPVLPRRIAELLGAGRALQAPGPSVWAWAPRGLGQGHFEVAVERVAGSLQATVIENRTGHSARVPAHALPAELLARLEGARVQVGPGGAIWDFRLPSTRRENVTLQVVQNATSLKALVVPLRGGLPYHPGGGRYELEFEMVRRRWSTSDPPDDVNSYIRRSVQAIEV